MLITRLVLAADRFRQWSIAQFVLLLLTILKLFPADMAINFMDRVARWIGPKTGRHKLTLINLRNAFPEKSDAEIEAIALESWGNMGRLAAEYVFLDQLFDFDPARAEPGRVEVSASRSSWNCGTIHGRSSSSRPIAAISRCCRLPARPSAST